MAQLLIDLGRSHNGLSDFQAQEFAITLAQAVDRHLHSRFSHSQLDGEFRVRLAGCGARKTVCQQIKKRLFSSSNMFLSQSIQSLLQDRARLSPLERRV